MLFLGGEASGGARHRSRWAQLAAVTGVTAAVALAGCSDDGSGQQAGTDASTTAAVTSVPPTSEDTLPVVPTTDRAPTTTRPAPTTTQPPPSTTTTAPPQAAGAGGPKETPRQIAVMVENLYSPNQRSSGRPQWGLSGAQVVVEGLVEGGITRFMALYDSTVPGPGMIGPVRSARLPFVEMAHGFDAEYAHWGGSQLALQLLTDPQYGDLDAQGNARGAFGRTSQRSGEHSGVTSWEGLNHAANALGVDQVSVIDTPWSREAARPGQPVQVGRIDLTFSSNQAMNACFQYNPATNSYDRYSTNGGITPHVDLLTGKPLSPSTVALLDMQTDIFDNGATRYVQIRTVGSGPLYLFKNGQRVDGRWERDATNKQFRFLTHEGQPIALPPGQTWLSLVVRSEGGNLNMLGPGATCT
jgi:Protein of unknown function (DUF3048) N-terminal domain/Protein of unknown function (DUF3048) C-terminal domain